MRKVLSSLMALLLLTSINQGQRKKKVKEEFDFRGITPLTISDLSWTPIMETEDEIYFLHKKRIRTTQGTIKIWTSRHPKNKISPRSKTLFEVNCNQELIRARAIVFYKPNGKVLTSEDGIQKWTEVVPESLGDEILIKVCRNKGQ